MFFKYHEIMRFYLLLSKSCGNKTALFHYVFKCLVLQSGIYLFQLVDWYSSAFALLLGSALEGIIVCWIYGKLY